MIGIITSKEMETKQIMKSYCKDKQIKICIIFSNFPENIAIKISYTVKGFKSNKNRI